MPAYNFDNRFASLVESGAKRQTIRKPRKRRTCPGDRLVLYTGQRTSQCRKLLETTCKSVRTVAVRSWAVEIDGQLVIGEELDAIAHADGFENAVDMLQWFGAHYTLPIEMEVIEW